MDLRIHLHRNVRDPALREHAQRSLEARLQRLSGALLGARLRLVDDNGPRGGEDHRCLVEVHLRDGSIVRVEGVGNDPHKVISQVTARAGRSVVRRTARSRDQRSERRRAAATR